MKHFLNGVIFLYYEESLVSSNLNSKLLRFHSIRPDSHISSLHLYAKKGNNIFMKLHLKFRAPPSKGFDTLSGPAFDLRVS